MNVIRKKFFYCILRQDIGFFDTNSVGELNTRLAEDIKKISDGMGDKIGITVQSLSRFVAGLAIAFYYGWELALVILAIAPILMTSAGIMFKITSSFTKKELDAYAAAGAIAEEVLNSIKTVTAFGGQIEEGVRYDKYLVNAKEVGIKRSLSTGLSIGTLFLGEFSKTELTARSNQIVWQHFTSSILSSFLLIWFGFLVWWEAHYRSR